MLLSSACFDGIPQPEVKDFETKPDPSQETVRQGIIPPNPFIRLAWDLDGSFLTLRYFFQLVLEFTNCLKESADLIGARLMGRWDNGAPTDLFPLQDNPVAGTDPS